MTNGSSMLRTGVLATLLLASSALTAPALAQELPRFNQVDSNGVDLVTGRFSFSLPEGSIGSGEAELALMRNWAGTAGWTDNWSGRLYTTTVGGVLHTFIEFGTYADSFSWAGGVYTSTKADGATLASTGSGLRYTARDGTTIDFANQDSETNGPFCPFTACSMPVQIRQPNGMTYTMNWDEEELCIQYAEGSCNHSTIFYRLTGVASSANYAFTITYATNDPGEGTAPPSDWFRRTQVQFTNLDGAPASLPTVTYSPVSSTVLDVTDIGGLTWRLTTAATAIGIRRPGSGTDDISATLSSGLVTQVVRDGITTGYSRNVSGTTATTTITDALSHSTIVVANTSIGRITSVTDPLSHQTQYQYDGSGRLIRVTRPEGDYTAYTYDGRGNVTETRAVAKSGSGLSDIVASASYPSSCTNPVTCNLPTATTDARVNTTDYTWDSTHGGLLTVTAPAPASGATRPQTRITYSQVTAVTGQPVYLPTNVSACQTTSSCNGQADESETNISYNTSNLLPTSVASGSGDGTTTATATTAWTYDSIGNLLTIDGPLSGTADTTRYRYNGARQVIGTIGPDPDGGGALLHRAIRVSYGAEGQSKVERGTVNSQSDADWANFATLEEVQTEYDSHSRPVVQRLVSGGTTYALTQTSYDSLGRPQCVAQRMNDTQFATASLPSDACTLDTEGSLGPDRISRTTYDYASQPILLQTGYGVTGVAADEVATTYTSNGRVETVTDAEANRTTYVYDGHDRLSRTRMPHPGTDNTSSTTDYEELTYETVAGGTRSSPLVVSRRLRDGNSIGMTYDALGRLTARDMPGSEPDATYSHDLLNRMTGASQGGHTLTFTYDALGRNLTQTNYIGTASSQYDAAGRRTRLTYPGSGLYVDYDHLVTGEISAIRENGATSGAGVLGSYAYDNRGRRTSLTRGNGTVTSYYYDDVSRLSLIIQDPNNPTYDINLGYSYNPAGQIVAATRSNDAYAWGGHYQVNRSYAANGLNQYTAAGSITPTYDSRGNLTSAGSTTYGYNADNMLISATTGSVALGYDPLLRLAWTTGNPNLTRFAYDGDSVIAEYDYGVALVRRYVHGPGTDEPLVQYEGTGTSDRRWFHADERGSIVAISNGSGVVTTVNTYDEYGIPGTGNGGRFQYTGQAWLGELGMYHYRARMYSPTLGRFLQTDPIGVGGGMNIYGYVGNDPVNLTDPAGLTPTYTACTGSRVCPSGQNGGIGSNPGASYVTSFGGFASFIEGGGRGSVTGSPGSVTTDTGGFPIITASTLSFLMLYDPVAGPVRAETRAEYEGRMRNEMTIYLRGAVIDAIERTCRCQIDENNLVALNPNMVLVRDPARLPRIFGRSFSWHATSYSASIPGSEFLVKLYVNDRSSQCSGSCVTITNSGSNVMHWINSWIFSQGDPVNTHYARQYCAQVGCGPRD